MEHKSMGSIISTRRKELGLTQNDLAEKMGVTDKAVSKWERSLSCPDLASIPKLAEVLGISLEELLNSDNLNSPKPKETPKIIFGWLLDMFLLAIAFYEGISIIIIAQQYEFINNTLLSSLGLGLVCIVFYLFRQSAKHNKEF